MLVEGRLTCLPKPEAHAKHSSETTLRISVLHPPSNSRKHSTDGETEAQSL